jgi:NitT/TauT family transport system substrate-binding protein
MTDHAENNAINRRSFLSQGCACCAGLVLAPAAAAFLTQIDAAEAASASATIRIGHLPAGCVSHLLLAKVRGLFEKHGINAQLTQFNSPADNLIALNASQLDLIHNPWTTTIAAYADSVKNLRIVGGSGKAGIELVARKGSVRTVAELIAAADKGLKIGTLKLDTLELVGYGVLAQHGKSYKNYEMTFFPSMVGMGEALITGAVDVATLAQPYAESVVKQSDGTYLADSNDVWGPEAPDCVITTTTDFIKSHRELITAYISVLKESADSFYADTDAAVRDLQPLYGAPPEILKVALHRQSPNPIIGKAGRDGVNRGVQYLIDLGYFPTNIANDVLDLSLQPA